MLSRVVRRLVNADHQGLEVNRSINFWLYRKDFHFLCFVSLRIQPPLIRSRYYVRIPLRDSHVVAGANERRLYSQANVLYSLGFLKLKTEGQILQT